MSGGPESMTPDDLTKLYQSIILDHAKAPRNRRRPDPVTAHAQRDNPLCGDRVTVYVAEDGEVRIADAAFEGDGCAISLASASILTETIRTLSPDEAQAIARALTARLLPATADGEPPTLPADLANRPEIQALLSVAHFPMRAPCAALAWEALMDAVSSDP